jgi:hypothetical protein
MAMVKEDISNPCAPDARISQNWIAVWFRHQLTRIGRTYLR